MKKLITGSVLLVAFILVGNVAQAATLSFSITPLENLAVGEKGNFKVTAPDAQGYSLVLSDGNKGGTFYGASDTTCTSPLSGEEITLAIASTKANKSFCYSNATPGTYTITVTTPTGELDSVSTDVTVIPVSAEIEIDKQTLSFGVQEVSSITIKNIAGIDPSTLIRYKSILTKDGVAVATHSSLYPDIGDDINDISTWSTITTDADGVAFFGPSTGFPLSVVSALTTEQGATTPFAATFQETGDYELTIQIINKSSNDEVLYSFAPIDFEVVAPATIEREGEVQDFATIQAAVDAASDGDTIELTSDVTTSQQITISKPLTFEGNGHTIFAPFAKTSDSNNSAIGVVGVEGEVIIKDLTIDGTGGSLWLNQLHGINTYKSSNVTLKNVAISNFGGAALNVNGTTVVADNLNTEDNVWGAVNVDPGKGVTLPSVFILNSGILSESNQIWSDGDNVDDTTTVNVHVEEDYTHYTSSDSDYQYWKNKAPIGSAYIGTVIYPSIQSAVTAATEGQTVMVGAGSYTENVVITSPITIQGVGTEGTKITAGSSGQPGEQNTAFFVRSDGVTIKDLTLIGTGSVQNRGITTLGGGISSLLVDNIEAYGFVTGIYLGSDTNDVLITGYNAHNNTVGVGSSGISNVSITNSTFANNTAEGFGADTVGVGVFVSKSSFVGNPAGVAHYSGNSIGASKNWWGFTTPNFESIVTGDVDTGPWYMDSGKTILSDEAEVPDEEGNVTVTEEKPHVVVTSSSQEVVVSVGSGVNQASVSVGSLITSGTGDIPKITATSTAVKIQIPQTKVTSSDTNWDGIIKLPKVVTSTVIPEAAPGTKATVALSIEVGDGDNKLTFDEPVKLTFPNQAGKLVGWSRGGTFHTITDTCNSSTAPTLSAGGECKIDSGVDLVVWTKHFTTFTTYTQTAVSTSSTSGGTSGQFTSAVRAEQLTTPVVGEVLGAFTEAERQAQIAAIKSQLITLINQLIGMLQVQLAAAQTARN